MYCMRRSENKEALITEGNTHCIYTKNYSILNLVTFAGQTNINFNRIAEAIEYIHANYRSQPDLAEVAKQVHLSPFHFQRLFTDWVGVSPKRFLQYTTIEYAKGLLQKEQASLSDIAFETGLSGTGRLHDLFIKIEAMTPGEYKNGGASLHISYSFLETVFGTVLVASTQKGICHISFADDEVLAMRELQVRFPNALFEQQCEPVHINAVQIFNSDWSKADEVKLHLKGSVFQIKVWETLLKIAPGRLTTYRSIANNVGNQNASRAVGSAVGNNPVAFLIPCHRVIQSTGVLGQYHWGAARKIAMIGWEAAQADREKEAV